LEALEEIIESNDEPIIVYYWYRHTFERLKDRFKKYNPRTLDSKKDQDDWNAGKIRLLLAQPTSMGHGINIQKGGRYEVWMGLPESLELYQQACGRLERQGQKADFNVRIRLTVANSFEEDILDSLNNKGEDQDLLMRAVDALKRKYKKA
jgi:SNF2 family DNA or RNA helicase